MFQDVEGPIVVLDRVAVSWRDSAEGSDRLAYWGQGDVLMRICAA